MLADILACPGMNNLLAYSAHDAFWRAPPWREGKNRYRLALRPVEIEDLWCPDPPLSRNKALQLAGNYPDCVATHAGYEQIRLEIPGVSRIGSRFPDWIANVAAEVSEDLCLLDTDSSNRLVAACVTAPGYWCLAEKIGHPLWDVHEPVAGMNQSIGQRIDEFFARLPVGRPFRRSNWFVHGEAVYFRQSPSERGEFPQDAASWHFRSERQTLLRLDERFVLFVIGTTFAPVQDLVRHPSAIKPLAQSLAAMTDDEIRYFGGVEKYRRITEYVGSLSDR